MNKLSLFLLIFLFLNINCYAAEKIEPSFDCKKASTKVEKMICSDAELAQLDNDLNKLYNKYMKFVSENLPDYKAILIKAQRNWMIERNKITNVWKLMEFYYPIIYQLELAFKPNYYPPKISSYDDKDVAYYWKYIPLSFYYKNGYIKSGNNIVDIFYDNDEICQNISSVKVLDFKDFKKRAKYVKNCYSENDNGTMSQGWSGYIAKYDNGYFAFDYPDEAYMPLHYVIKNKDGYYRPFIKESNSVTSNMYETIMFQKKKYGNIYKSLPEEFIWTNIVLMQGDSPLYEGYESVIPTVYNFKVPILYKNKVYIQEITIHNNIEHEGINYDEDPPVYDKSVIITLDSQLVRIFSYDDKGKEKLACVYRENKDSLEKKLKDYLLKYSIYDANRYIKYYLREDIDIYDYF